MSRFPDFYCIGSQKAATTWLYRCLQAHPDFHGSPYKEVHYFDSLYVDFHKRIHRARAETAARHAQDIAQRYPSPTLRRARSLLLTPKKRNAERRMAWWHEQAQRDIDDDWYRGVFDGAGAQQVVFDITPAYAVLPAVGVQHVHRLNPQAKVLLILRDPVERSFSHAKMLANKAGRPMDDDTLYSYATSALITSRDEVERILATWQGPFSDEQFLVAFYDDVQSTPYAFLQRLCEFIGVPFDRSYFPKATKRIYKGPPQPMSAALRARLLDYHAERLALLHRLFAAETTHWGAAP